MSFHIDSATTMGIIPVLCLLHLCSIILAKENCNEACSNKFKEISKSDGCKDGCRLAVVYTTLASNPQTIQKKCEEGCARTFDKDAGVEEACKFGCSNQFGRELGTVTLTENDAIIGVVGKELREKMQSTFGSMPYLRLLFQKAMDRMRNFDENFMWLPHRGHHGLSRSDLMGRDNVLSASPHGHVAESFKGPEVGNKNDNDEDILHVKPIKHRRIFLSVYPDPYHYSVARMHKSTDEASFVERLSQRARRMSILSQWLICFALLLCLLSMMGISLAIIRQIKLQQRLRARQNHVVIPASHVQPLPENKIPLESPTAVGIDYPLIHETPPPAYDQLSLQKEKA
uniref:Transmembrane protein n=1 Tax=Syphacia muris TaxID=451379 RepID=A0A0N5ASG0_9BILA